MKSGQFQLQPGITLDARRALWFEPERTLAVADLHLGYAWGSRAAGTMLPVETPDDTLERLAALVREFAPRELVVMGDIVHRAVALEPIKQHLRALHAALGATRLRLLAGNHDRGLPRVLRACGLEEALEPHARLGSHVLLHGDTAPPECEGRVFIGHEHPAIRVGDGVASVKCPCFLLGTPVVILPAFSKWAAGGEVRSGVFLSAAARAARFTHAVAILAGKLLPMKL